MKVPLPLLSLAALILIALSSPAPGLAGNDQWTPTGPYYGNLFTLAASPNFATDSTLFAGTRGDGVYKSTDGGSSWSAANSGMNSNASIIAIAVSPGFASDNTLFAGTGTGSVFKSTNGGASWTPKNIGLSSSVINWLAVSPNFTTDHTVFAGTDTGVFKTTNAGDGWSAVNTGFPLYTSVLSLAISPTFASDNTLYAGTANAGCYKSVDGGASWTAANNGLTDTAVYSLALSPSFATDHTLLAGTHSGGAFKSVDGGSSWTVINSGLTNMFIMNICFSPGFASDNTIFIGSDGGFFKSANAGSNWTPGSNNTSIYSVAVSPGFATDNTVFIATVWGAYKSTQGGVSGSWNASNYGLYPRTTMYSLGLSPAYAADRTIFSGSSNGLFRSNNGTASWAPANNGITSADITQVGVSPNFATDKTIFLGSFGGIFKSVDGGASWSLKGGLIPTSLAVSPAFSTDNTVFIGTYQDGVYYSNDGGATWQHNAISTFPIMSLAVSPGFASDKTLFVGIGLGALGGGGGVLRSVDGGAHWYQVGLNNTEVLSVITSPNFATDHTVFASTNSGVFKSPDAGASWTPVNAGLPSVPFGALAISPNFASDQTLFAGTDANGAYVSTNAGASWSGLNAGLPTGAGIYSLAVSPDFSTDRTLFAATKGYGVYSYMLSGAGGADTTPPTVSNVLPSGAVTSSTSTISAHYSDAGSGVNSASVVVYLDGNALNSCTAIANNVSCPVSGLLPGSHTISGSVSDNAGNSTAISGSFTVSRNYFFTWYDNIDGDNWLLLANPSSATGSLTYSLTIAGSAMDLSRYGNGVVAKGASITPAYTGIMGGPVEALSMAGGKGIVSQRILWPKGGNSLEEVSGTEESKLSNHFWWTWYDQKSPGYGNWTMIANPSATETVHAVISFVNAADNQPVTAESDISPGHNWNPTFAGKMGGPVEVKAFLAGGSWPTNARDVIASQRVLSGGGLAFNEMPGIADPAGGRSELSSDYLWTWYDNSSAGAIDWVLIANPSASADVYYEIDIAGTKVQDDSLTGPIGPGRNITPTFPGKMGGPVEVKTFSDAAHSIPENSIASQRTIWGPSFEEVPGYAKGALSTSYDWTWYDMQSPGSVNWVLIANPNNTTIDYQIKIGGVYQACDGQGNTSCPLAPGEKVLPTFPGKMGGPVEVTSTGGSVMASQRVLWNGYFNEVLGTVLQ